MPPAQQQQGGGGQHEGSMGIVWVIVGVFIFLWGTWYFAHAELVRLFFHLKLFEITIIQFFADVLGQTKSLILNANPQQVSFPTVVLVAGKVGYYLRIPLVIIMVLLGIVLYFKSATTGFKRTYDMKALLKSETEIWPYESPVMSLDLVKEDIDKGQWAMALSPMRFAKKYKLLKVKKRETKERVLGSREKIVATVLKNKANKVFAAQLGYLWPGAENLKPHVKALYAAFVAKAARKSDESRELLNKISHSAKQGKLNFSGAEELLKKYKNYPAVVEVSQKHAYLLTVMASMLQLARTDGVLSSAEFLWLKPVDRKLWFMLNAVGRQTVVSEVAGPFAHWLAEKEMGTALKTPMIEEAVIGLEEAISNIIYKPDVEQ
ncbi:MAG: type IVB secretion system coupling complex protein DotM/IcmP [Gammaproteobacteria bacterium]|jgi:intracellular multiplication protein IcmP